MKRIAKIQANLPEFRAHLQSLIPLMKPDLSTYAPNRYRLWLFHEAILGRKKAILPAHFDAQLYTFCQRVYPGSNIALISFNGKGAGWHSNGCIAAHRDDTYAIDKAVGVNLGSATFGYNPSRKSDSRKALDRYTLGDGDIYTFNCKHLHAVLDAEENRFSLNIWQLKADSRYPWCKPNNPAIAEWLEEMPF